MTSYLCCECQIFATPKFLAYTWHYNKAYWRDNVTTPPKYLSWLRLCLRCWNILWDQVETILIYRDRSCPRSISSHRAIPTAFPVDWSHHSNKLANTNEHFNQQRILEASLKNTAKRKLTVTEITSCNRKTHQSSNKQLNKVPLAKWTRPTDNTTSASLISVHVK